MSESAAMGSKIGIVCFSIIGLGNISGSFSSDKFGLYGRIISTCFTLFLVFCRLVVNPQGYFLLPAAIAFVFAVINFNRVLTDPLRDVFDAWGRRFYKDVQRNLTVSPGFGDETPGM